MSPNRFRHGQHRVDDGSNASLRERVPEPPLKFLCDHRLFVDAAAAQHGADETQAATKHEGEVDLRRRSTEDGNNHETTAQLQQSQVALEMARSGDIEDDIRSLAVVESCPRKVGLFIVDCQFGPEIATDGELLR